MKGGVFEFSLSETADKKWGSSETVLPTSIIKDAQILAVPYFDVKSNKFKGELSVTINSLDPDAEIFWGVDMIDTSTSYEGPIVLKNSTTLRAYVMKGNKESNTVSQRFYKVPSDKSITVLSQVNPMYTGGGPEALIDEITGSSNWRTGD